MIGEMEMEKEEFERKSNHAGWSYVEFDEALFADAIEVAGIRIAPMQDGSDRYVATWKDYRGKPRLSVCGKFGPPAIQYRYIKAQQEKAK